MASFCFRPEDVALESIQLETSSAPLQTGEIKLDVKKLDQAKIKELEKHDDLITKLDDWILSPDKNLLPNIAKLGKIVDQLYKYDKIVIYRGLGMAPDYQNLMGLAEATWWGGLCKKKETVKGYKFKYSVVDPISFTWDKFMAKQFGPIVVESVTGKSDPRLIITNELSYLVSQKRKVTPVTQREVIMLPKCDLQCTVLSA